MRETLDALETSGFEKYSIEYDRFLGELEAFVYEARKAVDDEWAKGPKHDINLEDLGL